jgi:hypothetical protein
MRLATLFLLGAASVGSLATAQIVTPDQSQPVAPPASTAPAMEPTAPAMPQATGTGPAAAPQAAPTTPGVPPSAVAPEASAPAATAPEAPPAPPPPPPPPTDPTAIALLDTLQNVCIPMTNGGNLAKLAKAAGFRKSGDNWVYKRPGYQFTVLPPGSNPGTCQVELIHPVDQAEPAKPMVVALHDWAVFDHGWTLDRNDKHVADGEEFITRSWVDNADGKHQALVLTTMRKPDDSPLSRNGETSEMFYSTSKIPS